VLAYSSDDRQHLSICDVRGLEHCAQEAEDIYLMRCRQRGACMRRSSGLPCVFTALTYLCARAMAQFTLPLKLRSTLEQSQGNC
jgi:hypothetical protein